MDLGFEMQDSSDFKISREPRHSTFSLIDHPVCAASVASRYFFYRAVTPPHEEGNIAHNTLICKTGRRGASIRLLPDLSRFMQRIPCFA